MQSRTLRELDTTHVIHGSTLIFLNKIIGTIKFETKIFAQHRAHICVIIFRKFFFIILFHILPKTNAMQLLVAKFLVHKTRLSVQLLFSNLRHHFDMTLITASSSVLTHVQLPKLHCLSDQTINKTRLFSNPLKHKKSLADRQINFHNHISVHLKTFKTNLHQIKYHIFNHTITV